MLDGIHEKVEKERRKPHSQGKFYPLPISFISNFHVFFVYVNTFSNKRNNPFLKKIKNKLYPNRHANMFFTDICSETEKWYDLFICGLIN